MELHGGNEQKGMNHAAKKVRPQLTGLILTKPVLLDYLV